MLGVASAVAETVGPVDILVNNAGIPSSGIKLRRFADSDPADWDPLLRVNVHGVLNCTHVVIPGMLDKQWGRIVTISSDSGRTGEAMIAAYSMSKAAGAGLMRSLAKELGPYGITCNSLSLGTIGTDEVHRSTDERMEKHLLRYPVRRLGRPSDVAAAVAWLVSDEGGWTTGQTIPVNGGFASS
jgi:3-oxoacyl-[acyl-carrier protein] reductase